MRDLGIVIEGQKPFTLLCVGAHSDDIEIGCGGTILSLLSRNANVAVHWVVLSAEGLRRAEARESARRFLRLARSRAVVIKGFRGSFFPYEGRKIKEEFESIKRNCNPDLVFTHYRHDLHQDHRVVSDLTWNTFRDHLILEYEIPKYDGDLGSPNVLVPLDKSTCQTKVRHLLESFRTQKSKHWFTAETFMSLLRLRGIEAGPHATYAEAFYGRKLTLSL